jgi:hypothetical protein
LTVEAAFSTGSWLHDDVQFVTSVVAGERREDAGEPLDFSSVVPQIVEIDREAEGQQDRSH